MNDNTQSQLIDIPFTDELKQEWLEKLKKTNKTFVKLQEEKYVAMDNQNKQYYNTLYFNTALFLIPPSLKDDYDINFTAALQGREFFNNLSTKMQSSKTFILDLLQHQYKGKIYYYLPYNSELRFDPDIVLATVKNGERVSYIADSIMKNREYVLAMMPYHYFKDKSKKDDYKQFQKLYDKDIELYKLHLIYHSPGEFYQLAIGKKDRNLYKQLSHDKSFILQLLQSATKTYNLPSSIYNLLPLTLRLDLDINHLMLSSNKHFIQYLPAELINDESFMTYAVQKYAVPIAYSSDDIQKNEHIVTMHVQNDKNNFQNLKFKTVSLALLALKLNSNISQIFPELVKNKDLVIQYLKVDPTNFDIVFDKYEDEFKHLDYHNDKEIMKLAITYNGQLLKKSTNLLQDVEFSNIASSVSNDILLLSETLMQDKETIIRFLTADKSNYAKLIEHPYLLQLYKNERDIIEILIQHHAGYISYSPTFKADKNMIKFAIKHGLNNITKIDSSLFHDKELMLLFVRLDKINYSLLPLSLKQDLDIIYETIKTAYGYKTVMDNSNYSNEIDFHIELLKRNPKIYEYISDSLPLKRNPSIILACLNETVDITISPYILNHFNVSNAEELKNFIVVNERMQNLSEQLEYKDETKHKIKI